MRKTLKFTILFLLFAVVGFLIYNVATGYKNKKEAEQRIQTLPNVTFKSITGDSVNLHSFDETKPLIIVYFHPECEHCHYEAEEIGNNATAFKNCQLIMVTADDSIKRVEKFCTTHNLWGVDNIEILFDRENLFKKTFGKAIIPSVYIYDKTQKLKKQFLGETKPKAIIEEIQDY